MPLTPTSTGYQLPRIPQQRPQLPQNLGAMQANANADLYGQISPQSQLIGFQQDAKQETDPLKRFYAMQQMGNMNQSIQAQEAAKKKALEEQFATMYSPQTLEQGQGQPSEQPGEFPGYFRPGAKPQGYAAQHFSNRYI